MDTTLPMLAGMVSTAIFAGSVLPMLHKALRTRELSSYSLGNIALAMVRREVPTGATLDCRWAEGQADVTAWPLPFPL